MEKRIIVITFIFAALNICTGQSLATNILHKQARLVYKGYVSAIIPGSTDSQGMWFGVRTKVEKVYKGLFYEDQIGISIRKPEVFDTINNWWTIRTDFQIKAGEVYVFFVTPRRLEDFDGKVYYNADLTNEVIEGIYFSEQLEGEIEQFSDALIESSSPLGPLVFQFLFQSSPTIFQGEIIQIIETNELHRYSLKVKNDSGEIYVNTIDLHCICESGEVRLGKNYLFFLAPIGNDRYLLTDRWLGIFEDNDVIAGYPEFYKSH